MISIASIVEGDGEVRALPVLLRRLFEWRPGDVPAQPLRPIRVHRDRFLNRDEDFRKQLLLAAAKCGDEGWILVALDADDDCPATLAAEAYRRAQQHVSHRRLSVVIATANLRPGSSRRPGRSMATGAFAARQSLPCRR